jgi:hypothetical protein
MKNILFFLSAQEIDKKYSEPALELVRLTVKDGHAFLYGGSEVGLMKQAAREVKKLKGRIVGVSCSQFEHIVNKDCDKIVVAKDIAERIKILLEESDAIIALPGGSGTLDEITAVIEGRKLNLHNKPIVLFNTNGFWNNLVKQYTHMRNEGFLPKEVQSLFFVSDDPKEVMIYLNKSFA